MDRDSIISYLEQLKTDELIDVAIAAADIEAIVPVLYSLIERININRRNKILETEIADIRKVVNQLGEELQQMKALNQAQAKLLQEKEALMNEKEAIDNIIRDKTALETLKQFVKQNDLNRLTEELTLLKEDTYNDTQHLLDFLETARLTFSDLQTKLTQNIAEVLEGIEHNRQEIRTKVNGSAKDIQIEAIHLRGYFEDSESEMQAALEQYNALSQQLNEIKQKIHEIKEKHTINIQAFQIHYASNQEIWGEIGKRHRLDEYFDTLISELESGLKRFDAELKAVVEKADKVIIH